MDKQVQTARLSLRGRLFQRDYTKQKEHRILVFETGIAGLQYHLHGKEDKQRLDAITPGTELLLYREPENENDEWAIAVYLTEDDLLGYISRYKNETIARLMDAGKRFIAITDDPVQIAKQEAERRPGKRSRKAYTENMSVPFSVYLIEEEN